MASPTEVQNQQAAALQKEMKDSMTVVATTTLVAPRPFPMVTNQLL